MIIFTKFHKNWSKIVDFLLLAKFWACLLFFAHPLPTYIVPSGLEWCYQFSINICWHCLSDSLYEFMTFVQVGGKRLNELWAVLWQKCSKYNKEQKLVIPPNKNFIHLLWYNVVLCILVRKSIAVIALSSMYDSFFFIFLES